MPALLHAATAAVASADQAERKALQRFQMWRSFIRELAEAAPRADAAERPELAPARIPTGSSRSPRST